MPDGGDGQVTRRFFLHLLAAALTLGLYMPAWLAWNDREVALRLGQSQAVLSAWAMGAGVMLGLIARFFFGGEEPWVAFVLSVLAVVVFLVGVFLVTKNLEEALESLGLESTAPPGLLVGGLTVVFVGVEVGNLVESLFVRIPVILTVLALPYAFWRLHVGFERVKAAVPVDGVKEGAGPEEAAG